MRKIKKIIISVISVLCVAMSIVMVSASATNSFTIKHKHDPQSVSYVEEKYKLMLQCYNGWGAVSYNNGQSSCYKYMKLTCYGYSNGDYNVQGQKNVRGTDKTLLLNGGPMATGYTQKVDYYGAAYMNSSASSDIRVKGHVIVYRP